MCEKILHDDSVAVSWHPLIFGFIIAVIVSEANRQSFKNVGWKIFWLYAPLLFRVAVNEIFIKLYTKFAYSIIFEIFRLEQFTRCFNKMNKIFRLCWIKS